MGKRLVINTSHMRDEYELWHERASDMRECYSYEDDDDDIHNLHVRYANFSEDDDSEDDDDSYDDDSYDDDSEHDDSYDEHDSEDEDEDEDDSED